MEFDMEFDMDLMDVWGCLWMFGVSRQHTLRNSVNWSELFDIVCLSIKSHTTATYIHYFGAFAWHCMGHAFQLFWRPCIFFQQLIGVRCAGRQYIFVSNEQVLTYTAHDNIFNSAAWFHQNSNRPVPDAFQFLTISNLFRTCLNRVDIVWWAASSWYKLPDQALEEEVAVKSSFDGCDRRSLLDTGRCYQLLAVAIQYIPHASDHFRFWSILNSLSLLLFAVFFWTL